MARKYKVNPTCQRGVRQSAFCPVLSAWPLLTLILVVYLVFSATAFAKGGDPLWSSTDAVPGKQEAKAMTVDSAGNTIVVGYTGSNANDYYVAKFKADGTGTAWTPVTFGNSGEDVATAVTVDSLNNIIVTGYTWNGSDRDIHTIKYDGATGALLWQHTLTNTSGNDSATAVAVDASNNIYVAGSYFNGVKTDDYIVIKYPSGGATPTWTEIYDDPDNANKINKILSMAVNSTGIAVTGYSGRGTTFDMLTRKYGLDQSFIRQWRYANSGDCMGKAVRMDIAGNVIVTGYSTNALNNKDIYTVKYNPASDTPVWEKPYNGNSTDEPVGLWLDSAGDAYVTGVSNTLAGNDDYITLRYDGANGNQKWKALFDAGNGATDIPVGIVVDEAADGGVFVTGFTTISGSDDFMTLKYKKDDGGLLWEKAWNGSDNKNDRPIGIALEPAGGPVPRSVYVAGWTDSTATGYDFQVVKYDFGALNAPTSLTAAAASNTSITLDWKDNSSNEDKFIIQRKLGEGGTWADITTTPSPLPANTITYTDTGLTANNYYYYRVRANNAANNDSDYSNEARALTKVVSYAAPSWSYLYNGADNRDDVATAITSGSDNHPVVTGYSDLSEEGVVGPDANTYDYMTLMIDRADKSIKWKARYDSEDGGTDMAAGVALDNAGNVLVTGTAYLAGGGDKSDELYTRKVATAGLNDPNATPAFIWDHQYGTLNGIDLATAIAMIRDGSNSSVVIGHGGNSAVPQDDDTFIIKYNNDGTRPWTPIVYNSDRNDIPSAVAFDASGNIFVTGYSYDKTPDPSNSFDWFTNKYNGATGALIWSDIYDSGFGADKSLSIDVDKAGNAYVTGYAKNSAGQFVFQTIKYDGAQTPAGNRRIWSASYNKPGFDARAVSVKVDPVDGAVVVGGTAYMSATDSDLHLIRYNPADGSELWNKNFDRTGYDYATTMTMDASGYIYLAGNSRTGPDTDADFHSSSNVLSLIYDYEGTFLGAMTYNGAANKQDEVSAITVNGIGEAFIAGFGRNAAATDNKDYIVLKQINSYLLAPGNFTAIGQADYTKMDLTWQVPASGPTFRIYRTPGPSSPLSVWTQLIPSPGAGSVNYTDTTVPLQGTNYCYTIETISGSLNSRKTETCATNRLSKPTLSPLTVDSTTQITLNWTQITGNTGYKIERKIGAGAWGDLIVKAAGQNSHVDTGLTAGTTYYYRVSTNSAIGYSLASNEQNAITKPAAPAMAANGTIAMVSAIINWTNVAGETGYKLERKEGAGGAWSEIITRGVDVLTYTNTGLTSNTQYYYRVRAYNASGDSDYSGEQGALTKFTTPTLSSATGIATNTIDLVWANVDGNTGYTVQFVACNQNTAANAATYCPSTSYYGAFTTVATVGAGVTTYQHTGRITGYAYRYQIIANTTGNSSDPSNAIIAWTYMTGPAVTITPASDTSLTVSWPDIVGETNYTLERKQPAAEPPADSWAELAGSIGMAANTITKTDTGLGLSTEYCYRVRAYSSNTNGPPSVYSSNEPCLFTPLAAPVQNAPTGITASQVDLSWSNVAGNTGYEIERCQFTQLTTPQNATTYLNNPSYWTACSTIATPPVDSTSYQNTGLTVGYTYRYRVRDTYSGGYSAWSNGQPVTTIPATPSLGVPTSPSTTQLNLSWNSINGETSFKLEWKERSGADCSAGAWGGPITINQNLTTYSHTGRTTGTYYCYRLYATNSSGDSGYSTERSQVTLPIPPTLDVPSAVTATQAVLTWNNVAGNTSYKIERKTGAAGAWGTIFTTAADAVTYTNTGLTAGTLYYYRISTNNAAGSSTTSAEQSTTTTPVAPTVTATAVSYYRIDLSWPVKSGATNYKIERKEGAGSYSQIDNVAVSYVENYCGDDYPTVACPSLSAVTTIYQSSGLSGNTTYCYQLKAWNSTGGDSGYSTEKCATTSAMPLQNLTATPMDGGFKIRLDWTPIVCLPIACDAPTGYELQRQVRDGNWVLLKTLDGETLTYTDKIAIDPGKQYRYRVRSLNGADKSPYSEAMTFAKPYSAAANVCTE